MRAMIKRQLLRRGGSGGGGGGGSPAGFFIDSVAGSDSNTGTSSAQAWATWAKFAASGLTNNARLFWKMGGRWREHADFTGFTGVVATYYGDFTQPLPTFDAADIASSGGWAIVSAGPCYSRAWAHDYGTDITKHKIRVWEDGAPMVYRTSQALAEANPGSYFVPTTMASPQTVMISPTGGGNPASNGKVYEITKREKCITEAGNEIHWACGMRAGIHDGAIYISGRNSSHLLAMDCLCHNMWVEPGSKIVKSVGYLTDQRSSSGRYTFISYVAGAVGENTDYEDIYCYSDGGGFYAHTNGASYQGALTYTRCYGRSTSSSSMFAGANITSFAITDCTAEFTASSITKGVEYPCDGIINGLYVELAATPLSTSDPTVQHTLTVADMIVYLGAGATAGTVQSVNLLANIDHSTFYSSGAGPAGNRRIFGTGVDTGQSLTNCIFYRFGHIYSWASANQPAASNYNVFYDPTPANISFSLRSAIYAGFTAYRAGATDLDVNSAAGDPLFTDIANKIMTVQGGSPALTGGRSSGSRKDLRPPVWAPFLTGWGQRYLMIDGHVPPA